MRQNELGFTALPHPASRAKAALAARAARAGLWLAAALAGALMAAALLLWSRYGATVFFDTLSAGIGSCL
ncbi:hypothetical protein V5F38_17930 [Xanthobacter sp. V0B-10]|uniref:hypothetical protein n=1 Tax=Xanthobacter albus TaxID=3119929 RepID=UPI00372BCE41